MMLFIWENVLRDYSAGMAVAYAPDLVEALRSFPPDVAEQLGAPTHVIDTRKEKTTVAAYVYGGS